MMVCCFFVKRAPLKFFAFLLVFLFFGEVSFLSFFLFNGIDGLCHLDLADDSELRCSHIGSHFFFSEFVFTFFFSFSLPGSARGK